MRNHREGSFFPLLFLTFFFLLLEISFFIQCNQDYLADYTFMTDHLRVPWRILPAIVFFVLAELLVHVGYCVLIWLIASCLAKLFRLSPKKQLIFSMSCWVAGIVMVLAANQYFYPNSKFAELSHFFFPKIFNQASTKNHFHLKPDKSMTANIATSEKPNIIIVGVDSLRPDFLSYFGSDNPTPFFDTFLRHATSFTEAVTPLARTFPSWTGILSGEYPRQIGIRTNLASHDHINFSATLPSVLQQAGYETFFATDETRFSNLDTRFGFDRIVTPPMGLNDFLLGTFNDFPLSNLLINTPVGQWLFPYSYANRPVYFSYDPNSFLRLVQPYLTEKRQKPLFLAIHFCLPHHPYLWASLPGSQFEPLDRYKKSIIRTDQQLQDFFNLLKQAHLLDHAVVVLLSDHGEALELPGDRITEKNLFLKSNKKSTMPMFYPPSLDNEAVNQSVGHGTDVLGLSQYHTLLAFQLYGMGKQRPGRVGGYVSLLDIKQTIFDLIKIKPNHAISLAPLINGNTRHYKKHSHIFLESDFSPQAIHTVYPETHQVILQGIQLFQINPQTTRLTVKDEMNQMIIKSKQYADIHGDWILALYPQNNHYRMPILINRISGIWTNDLHSPFAQQSPAAAMLAALKGFYGNEL